MSTVRGRESYYCHYYYYYYYYYYYCYYLFFYYFVYYYYYYYYHGGLKTCSCSAAKGFPLELPGVAPWRCSVLRQEDGIRSQSPASATICRCSEVWCISQELLHSCIVLFPQAGGEVGRWVRRRSYRYNDEHVAPSMKPCSLAAYAQMCGVPCPRSHHRAIFRKGG